MLRLLNPAALGFYILLCVIGTVFTTIDVFLSIFVLEDLNMTEKWFGKNKAYLPHVFFFLKSPSKG